jgi:tetratricopeptide (TPR) repeat protein
LLLRELGDPYGISLVMNNLAGTMERLGDTPQAMQLYTETLALKRELHDRNGIATGLHNLAFMVSEQGDQARALSMMMESLALFQELEDWRDLASSLEGIGTVAMRLGQLERAAMLWGAAESLRAALGAPLSPADSARHERDKAVLHAQLDGPRLDAAWAAGRTMTPAQAADEARRAAQPPERLA